MRKKTFQPGEILTAADVNDHLNPGVAAHLAASSWTGVATPPAVGGSATGTTYVKHTITFPSGRFTRPPLVFASLATAGAGGSNRVILSVSSATTTSVDVWFWAIPGSNLAGLSLRANVLAVQMEA